MKQKMRDNDNCNMPRHPLYTEALLVPCIFHTTKSLCKQDDQSVSDLMHVVPLASIAHWRSWCRYDTDILPALLALSDGCPAVNKAYCMDCSGELLTHWGRDKMDAISHTTLWSAFSSMKMFEFRLKFHWSLFLRVQLTIFHHWFR